MTPLAWYGILAAIAAVVAAYFVGFSAGRTMGREEGFTEGRREGSKEGSARGYAVGFDRGRRNQGDGGEDGPPPRPKFLFAIIGLILGGTILFILSQLQRGEVEPSPNPDIGIPGEPLLPPPGEPLLVPPGEPSIDR